MKRLTDILAIACVICAIVTGFMLHKQVHHLYIYNDHTLWTLHEVVGLLLAVLLAMHCVHHKFWFTNYVKLPAKRKCVTTILLSVGVLILVSGGMLMFGSQSHFVSISHYILGILFTLLAIGHIAKRWKMFVALQR